MLKRKGVLISLTLTLITMVVVFILSEVLFRALLFSEVKFMKHLRNPSLYADSDSSDEFWKLRVALGGQPRKLNDTLVGHLSPEIEPGSYRHVNGNQLGSRRAVLLFGDSFADCATSSQECFEGILGDMPYFSGKYLLLNYGVGGFGLDQSYLLYQKVIDLYDDPIVIFSFLDGDMDRCVLSMREGQKPFFVLEQGQLQLKGLPIEFDQEHWFANHPPRITSYLFRLMLHNAAGGIIDANSPLNLKTEQKKKITETIIIKAAEDLKTRGLQHVFLVFEGLHRVWRRPLNWRITFLEELFAGNNIPHIWARKAHEDVIEKGSYDYREYILTSLDHHPNRRSNELLSRRILNWIEKGITD